MRRALRLTLTVLIICIVMTIMLRLDLLLNLLGLNPVWDKEYVWSDIIEVTDTDTYGDYDPYPCIHDDRLYVVWTTYDNVTSSGRDSDIVLRSYDGTDWSATEELTYWNDSSSDGLAQLASYKGELYLVWVKHAANDWVWDWNIVLTHFDGVTWSNRTPVGYITRDTNPSFSYYSGTDKLYIAWTAIGTIDNEKKYALYIYGFDEHGDEVRFTEVIPSPAHHVGHPQLMEYKNALYAFWEFRYDEEAEHKNIAIGRYDGVSWQNVAEIGSVDHVGEDIHPQVAVYDGLLYCLWQTNDNVASSGDDYDIVFGHFDGAAWHFEGELADTNDTGYDGFVDAAVFDEQLYVTWTTNDPGISTGGDFDIVLRQYDGNKWGDVIEVSPPNDTGEDRIPRLAVAGDKLYVVWETNNANISNGTDFDIVLRTLTVKRTLRGAMFSLEIYPDRFQAIVRAVDMGVFGLLVLLARCERAEQTAKNGVRAWP